MISLPRDSYSADCACHNAAWEEPASHFLHQYRPDCDVKWLRRYTVCHHKNRRVAEINVVRDDDVRGDDSCASRNSHRRHRIAICIHGCVVEGAAIADVAAFLMEDPYQRIVGWRLRIVAISHCLGETIELETGDLNSTSWHDIRRACLYHWPKTVLRRRRVRMIRVKRGIPLPAKHDVAVRKQQEPRAVGGAIVVERIVRSVERGSVELKKPARTGPITLSVSLAGARSEITIHHQGCRAIRDSDLLSVLVWQVRSV